MQVHQKLTQLRAQRGLWPRPAASTCRQKRQRPSCELGAETEQTAVISTSLRIAGRRVAGKQARCFVISCVRLGI
ncbi:hypothetical protein EYF80_038655 [Liparis tanakae]|uniref:Uncharacterized protein n=1 Tax=Liparis tanakae TaxID=230148 RepID=A0A4Z2GEJ2_9TELE|nr:hypothetical protein EYF80_038655 [Liparis tanakae]